MVADRGGPGGRGKHAGRGHERLFPRLPSGADDRSGLRDLFPVQHDLRFGSRGACAPFAASAARTRRWIDTICFGRCTRSWKSSAGEQPAAADTRAAAKVSDLLSMRSWSPGRLRREIRRAERRDLLRRSGPGQVYLTKAGLDEAARLTRQHRLWELFLITYADIAPSRVDRDADAIEHVLEPEIVAELE